MCRHVLTCLDILFVLTNIKNDYNDEILKEMLKIHKIFKYGTRRLKVDCRTASLQARGQKSSLIA